VLAFLKKLARKTLYSLAAIQFSLQLKLLFLMLLLPLLLLPLMMLLLTLLLA
jgi:hypothetical protein